MRLRLTDPPPFLSPAVPTEREGVTTHRQYSLGDCWLATRDDEDRWCMFADGEYRQPLKDGGWGSSGWKVTGALPNVTVHPSINIVGSWHGWIRAGVIQ